MLKRQRFICSTQMPLYTITIQTCSVEVHLLHTDASTHHQNTNLKDRGSSAPHICLFTPSQYRPEVWRFICSTQMSLHTITIQTWSVEVYLPLTDASAHHHYTNIKCEVHLLNTDASTHHHNTNLKCWGLSAPHRCLYTPSLYKHKVWRFICSHTDVSAHHNNTNMNCGGSSAPQKYLYSPSQYKPKGWRFIYSYRCLYLPSQYKPVVCRFICSSHMQTSTLEVCIVMVSKDICEEQMSHHTSDLYCDGVQRHLWGADELPHFRFVLWYCAETSVRSRWTTTLQICIVILCRRHPWGADELADFKLV